MWHLFEFLHGFIIVSPILAERLKPSHNLFLCMLLEKRYSISTFLFSFINTGKEYLVRSTGLEPVSFRLIFGHVLYPQPIAPPIELQANLKWLQKFDLNKYLSS